MEPTPPPPTGRPVVLLATSRDWPDGEPGHESLDAALATRGLDARWVPWDAAGVDWPAADVVAVRSTWDYEHRLAEFLAWVDGVGPRLLNGAAVLRWNTDKRYLLDLAGAGLPVVPTVSADEATSVRVAAAGFGHAVVKPRVGASGRGVQVLAPADAWQPDAVAPDGPWIVQPLVRSIHVDGETSVFVLGGRPASQVHKLPGPGSREVRVHEEYGGSSRPVPLTDEAAGLASRAVAVVGRLHASDIAYARVDLMRVDGRLVVSEVELTEPGLYLDVVPANAEPFAEVVAVRARKRV